MNKHLLILAFIFISSSAYAVLLKPVSGSSIGINNTSSNNISNNTVNSNNETLDNLDNENQTTFNPNNINNKWMKIKIGKVLVFDISQKIAIINNETYFVNTSTKIYDGQLADIKKGTRIKFNTNEKNVIIELWILK